MKSIVKNITFTVSSNLTSFLVNAVVVLIIPRLIGVAEYGYFQLYLLLVSYAFYFHFGWCDGLYLRSVGTSYDDLDEEIISSQFCGLCLMTIAIAVFSEICIFIFFGGTDYFVIYSGVSFALLFITPKIFFSVIMQATNRMKEYSAIILIEKVVYALLLISFLFGGIREANILIVTDILGKISAFALGAYFCKEVLFEKLYRRNIKTYFNEMRTNIHVGIFLLVSNVASILITSVVQLLIENHYGIEAFSQIALSFNMSKFLMVVVAAMGVVLVPLLKHMSKQKLSETYIYVRSLLMLILGLFLLLYYPLREFLNVWLPDYAESIYFLAFLFPICLFEGKTQLLVNAYMKALRGERTLCKVNVVTVLLSLGCAFFAVYILDSIFCAVIVVPYVLAFRCLLLELSIQKSLNISVVKPAILEIVLASVFLASCYLLNTVCAIVVYLISYFLYLLLTKSDIRKTFTFLRNQTSK